MRALIAPYLEENLVNIIGGCCGTNPEHIKQIVEETLKYRPRIPEKSNQL